MDLSPNTPSTESSLQSLIKTHPLISISLALSVGALALGAFGILQGSAPASPQFSVVEEAETSVRIAVDVEGEVARPGLIELNPVANEDLRIADALEAAGGLLPSADTDYVERNLNLAAIVTDGMKLYIPKKGSQTVSTTNEAQDGKTNVNAASLSALTKLKQIGQTRAEAIIANRPYSSLEELKTKAKLPASVVEGIKDEVSF